MASFDPVSSGQGFPGVDPDLHDVALLIHEEFDGQLGPRAVDECLGHVAAQFAGAPIRAFVPLLVRRYVREELQARRKATLGLSADLSADIA